MKYKRCRGCNAQGHNLKTCVNVDLDILYAKLVGAPDDDNEDNSSESDGSAMSDEGEMDDINFPAAAVTSDQVRKRSRSHELAVITAEATGGAPLRRTRGNK